MKPKDRLLRTMLLYGLSPALLALIASVVVLRPLTAYQDGFHGPEAMWHDLREWARTGELQFPSWSRACRGHLPRPPAF
jgi:hypothetical protein